MILSLRRRRAARRAGNKQHEHENGNMELTIPSHFQCPISLELMKDPVTLSTGITYDRQSIETWIEGGNHTCPSTKQELRSLEPIPNHAIRKMIQDWCVDNRSYGVERIPTPRIPVSSVEILEILSKITIACRREDRVGCRQLVAEVKALGKESDRNRRCIVANGTGCVLSTAFETFSKASFDENVAVLEEILGVLTWMLFPLDGEAKSHLGSAASLHCIVWFLKSGDLSARRNAVLALKELLSSDQQKAYALAEIQGAIEALVKLIEKPICPTSTKATLMVIFHMVSSPPTNEKIMAKLVEMRLVSLLVDMLVDFERSICEKALGVLDGICSFEEGRESAYDHSLIMPVLVKKILRVSHLATEFSVSILWKLNKNEKREDGGVLVEALQVGAFQKLLLLLQVGCDERTREKATELLKLLNPHRARLECIDSMDFKNLKRPF
ncbi:hypothetical protein L1049_006641 [Liquidambar formosana]|uniref:U-box domain-containing protein n=1 Tax=Liquidambar formosana TaxID=63359 RepID=A0AAP0WR93_LIQFO